MENFVLVVDFEIRPENIDRFVDLISENARRSVTAEPGCLQFDVIRSRSAPNRITLYEVYADPAAFELHKKMPHVATFFAAAKGMIANQSFHEFDRVHAASEAG